MDEEAGEINEVDDTQPGSEGTPPAEAAHVSKWLERIARAEKAHRKAFKQMRKSMDIVALGSDKEWDESEKYTVPILARHINLAVAQLYAKNPKATVKRKPRLLYTVWDGTLESVQQATLAATSGDPAAIEAYMELQQDIQSAKTYNLMADRTAKTLEIVWDHVLDEQTLGTKQQLKALVRRTKTTGVGYVKMDFQREFEPSPKPDERIQDSTEQIAHVQQLSAAEARGDVEDDSADMQEMLVAQDALQQQTPITREGIVFSYPGSTRIILDPACSDLKTLSGTRWIAEKLFLTAQEIEKYYHVRVKGSRAEALQAFEIESDKNHEKGALRVYEVQDRDTGTFFTVCDGHEGYLKAPDNPPVFLERFYTVFPLVFNDVEHETKIFPPSDVWRARHMQAEYNRSREARREHRVAARPYWIAAKGALEEDEKKRFQERSPHELVEVAALLDGQSVDSVIQRGPSANIDQNLYETETINQDILRTVGAQEANLGGLSGATATEASIGEASRSASTADNVDDLDDLLTMLARAGGVVLLMEMSKEKVIEIAGPGAVWPDAPPSRLELSRELMLSVEAGSSGRPNRAAGLADLERSAPFILQLPGASPKPLARKYSTLLDMDFDELYQEGAMSIIAQNTLAGSAPQEGGGPIPAAQGGQGGASQTPAQPGSEGAQAGMTQPDAQVAA